jgi:hypothetical protein
VGVVLNFSEAEVRQALQEIDRSQAALDRTISERNNYRGWQERTLRAENVYRASQDLFVLLDRYERSGLLLYSEILAANAAQTEVQQLRLAS